MREMQNQMFIVQQQITDRHEEADAERLARSARQPEASRGGWPLLRVLRLRRTQPARA